MKALSLTQPWATLVAVGAKKIETRSWSSSFRGRIAIHASKGFPGYAKEYCYNKTFQRYLRRNEADQFYVKDLIGSLPLGAIIATAELAWVMSTNAVGGLRWMLPQEGTPEHAFGNYERNRYAWFLEGVVALPEPIPCKGALSLWDVPSEIVEAIKR